MAANFDFKNLDKFNDTFYLLSEKEVKDILLYDANNIDNFDDIFNNNLLKVSNGKYDIIYSDKKYLSPEELEYRIDYLEKQIKILQLASIKFNEYEESLKIRLQKLKWRSAKRKSLSNLSTIDRRKVWNNSKKNSAKKSAKRKAKF